MSDPVILTPPLLSLCCIDYPYKKPAPWIHWPYFILYYVPTSDKSTNIAPQNTNSLLSLPLYHYYRCNPYCQSLWSRNRDLWGKFNLYLSLLRSSFCPFAVLSKAWADKIYPLSACISRSLFEGQARQWALNIWILEHFRPPACIHALMLGWCSLIDTNISMKARSGRSIGRYAHPSPSRPVLSKTRYVVYPV